MKIVFKDFLFNKGILVNDYNREESCTFEVRFSLAYLFAVNVTEGIEKLDRSMIPYVSRRLGENVPKPFYNGFPQSVRELSPDALLFDQLLHYTRTYGLGCFDGPGYSVMEESFERVAFKEEVTPKKFICLDEKEAEKRLQGYVSDMLASTRPLAPAAFSIVLDYIREYGQLPERIASKHTVVCLLDELRDTRLVKHLYLSDVLKLVEEIQYNRYFSSDIKRLNFKNADRKFISDVLDLIFAEGYLDVRSCYEKKALWAGLLHHIHYKPRCERAREFINLMRNRGNESVYSELERKIAEGDIRGAVDCLVEGKGQGALIRSLNYLASRASDGDVDYIISRLDRVKPLLLLQMLVRFATYDTEGGPRQFGFIRQGLYHVHRETGSEMKHRRSLLSEEKAEKLRSAIEERFVERMKHRLGRVYISKEMYDVAVPLKAAAGSLGYGVLPSGSRMHIGEGKKIRGFTYWEKVNDIDLSIIGVKENGKRREFSWRTMYASQSEGLTFSGDETSGYNGGSEYYDLDLDACRKLYPDVKYFVFCNNVYSDAHFNECICRAGYMMRDTEDSGEIFEPKTVKSSFTVDCDSSFCYMFAIDPWERRFIWLNTSMQGDSHLAVEGDMGFVEDLVRMCDIMSVGRLFELMATELVARPEDAELILSDEEPEAPEGVEILRSCDFERVLAMLE